MLHLSTPRLSIVPPPLRSPLRAPRISDDAFRLMVVLALGIIAMSIYALACSAALARYDRIEREWRRA